MTEINILLIIVRDLNALLYRKTGKGKKMEKAAGHILKSNNVKLEGRFRLDVGQGVPNSANEKNITLAPAQVCILENHPEFAVMEVTCGCGTKTCIKCEYTDAKPAEQGPDQKNDGENDNAS